MIKGYELADGSYSREYKVGDKFVVVVTSDDSDLREGQIVVLSDNDGSSCPFFNNDNLSIYWYKLHPHGSVSTKKNLKNCYPLAGKK